MELDEELDKDEEAIFVLVVGGSVVGGRPLLMAVLSSPEVTISCQRPRTIYEAQEIFCLYYATAIAVAIYAATSAVGLNTAVARSGSR